MAKLGFSATGVVKRSDWGLTFAAPALSDEVELVIETEFMPPKS
ncbi:YceI family protein [Consotaella salsifontis]|nr:YceI family protein [Consotaella salsifontis]